MPKPCSRPRRRFRAKAELVGCHGQTLYHQGEPAELSRAQVGRHLADRRGRGDRGSNRRPGRIRFPSGRHGRRRQRRAAGSLSRLPALSRPASRAHRAEHRRDRQSHRNPGRRAPPRQVIALSTPAPATWSLMLSWNGFSAALRSRRQQSRPRARCSNRWSHELARTAIFQPQASKDRRPRGVRA